jgi:UDPglucose--hexose-1-phosphate uridylyltransferase
MRRNPLIGSWAVIAPERANRPADRRVSTQRSSPAACPFCPGNEASTGQEIARLPDPNGLHAWGLRVFPNRYPAFRIEETPRSRAAGPYDMQAAVGAHEVFVETPLHDHPATATRMVELRNVFRAWRERVRDLQRDDRIAHCVVFKNEGVLAGATLEHPHSQLIALPVVPTSLVTECTNAREHYACHGRCLVCDMVDWERSQRERVVLESADAVAFMPWASRVAFETWIVPTRHASHFERDADAKLAAVADMTLRVLVRLEASIPQLAYNLLVATAPMRDAERADYHWHIRILPSVSRQAGFEWASGCHINTTAPEAAAAWLRDLDVAEPLP